MTARRTTNIEKYLKSKNSEKDILSPEDISQNVQPTERIFFGSTKY